jgi:hypothetical protein
MKHHAVLFLIAALPALADTRFQARHMTRDDVPAGKGQCDIRLQVDNEVEVAVRGDFVAVRTLSGRDATDAGSECNVPLPNRDVVGFNFQVIDRRGDIRLVEEPSRRNDFAAIVSIRDPESGFGRYHFRLSWNIVRDDDRRRDDDMRRRDDDRRPNDDARRDHAGGGFSWNNVANYKGIGSGRATFNDRGEMHLGEVNIDIDRGGKIVAWFRTERDHPLQFSGQVMAQENGRWKADVVSDDRRLRGPMWITLDDRQRIMSVSVEATDGQDRLRLNWERR